MPSIDGGHAASSGVVFGCRKIPPRPAESPLRIPLQKGAQGQQASAVFLSLCSSSAAMSSSFAHCVGQPVRTSSANKRTAHANAHNHDHDYATKPAVTSEFFLLFPTCRSLKKTCSAKLAVREPRNRKHAAFHRRMPCRRRIILSRLACAPWPTFLPGTCQIAAAFCTHLLAVPQVLVKVVPQALQGYQGTRARYKRRRIELTAWARSGRKGPEMMNPKRCIGVLDSSR